MSGIDICDRSELAKLADNTVMKNWVVKLRSKDTNQDIVIHGRTLYRRNEDNVNISIIGNIMTTIFLLTSIVLFVSAAISSVMKFVFRKKISIALIIFLFLIAFVCYALYFLPQYMMG